ncbi:hypothetical protein [Xenorhabdus innexi]|uniref:Uncharacterized protein n=1 Tax=Xenorhabdus innexi TaxID=290109 RepID=A0A1N6MZ15_9GAMM|nr:hypothetical protein [Xenorhabdus innexi]PHM31224.1 hypothetical protein Xinn_02933 [Xenorhabdus innexi]SIP74014.1 hypothetical protein XIS1_490011 [Xenorhabdus innexi]
MSELNTKELKKTTIPDAFWDDIEGATKGVKEILQYIFLAVQAAEKLPKDTVDQINYALEEIYKATINILEKQKEKHLI